ncbi:hypothetical protein FDECE_1410 [Fusarium decemcellulare]|nr:hypothetical protein FDECE_1410 [Fusarium decemcellulare]
MSANTMIDLAAKPQIHHDEGESTKTAPADRSSHYERTTKYMVVFSVWIGMFGWLANFDQAFGGIVLVMQPFNKSFGTCVTSPAADGTPVETCSTTALQQSLMQLSVLFMSGGGLLAGLFGDMLGRRRSLQLGCMIIAVSAGGMMGTQGNFTNFLVCKCISGVGIGVLASTAPTYGSESVAPGKRGLLMGLYNVGLASGNVVAAAVSVGSSRFSSYWSWRTPIACQIPPAIILALGAFFAPESPRWLLTKDRRDEAAKSFAKFSQQDVNSPNVAEQVEAVVCHIEMERQLEQETSFRQVFRGLDLKRTHVAVLVLLGNALTGVQFVIPYTALFLSQIGISNPYTLNVAVSSAILAGCLPGAFLCEYLGRRLCLLGGYSVMGTSMLIFAVVASVLSQSSTTAQNVCVAILCLWAFTFGATSGPTAWVSSVEMHAIRLRTMGQAYAVILYEIFSFGSAFWTPYMLNAEYGNMGTNVGYFYFGITIVIIILTFLFVPETAKLSLEQVDEYFLGGEPAWKTSMAKNKRIAATG